MATLTMKELLEAGVHFGHQTKRWNPKMQKYIFGERNGIYIIDLQKTLKKFREAYAFMRDLAAEGGSGTSPARLYNLKDDIGEKTDLAAKMPDKVKELHADLVAWRKAVNAPMPAKREK